MATKRYLEFQNLATEAIGAELTQAQGDIVRMKFDHGSKGLQDPSQIGVLKKEIARLKTEIRSREIKAMSTEELAGRSKKRFRRN
jgi:large subunit ribosomal protein L29